MLASNIEVFFREKGWWHDDVPETYDVALRELGIDPASEFGSFYRHVEDAPTFLNRGTELYQVCWFALNTNYASAIADTHRTLGLPETYIPLDSFEGEGGYFYNRETGEVAEVSLGESLRNRIAGEEPPRWSSFGSFLEWFFEIGQVSQSGQS